MMASIPNMRSTPLPVPRPAPAARRRAVRGSRPTVAAAGPVPVAPPFQALPSTRSVDDIARVAAPEGGARRNVPRRRSKADDRRRIDPAAQRTS